MGIHTSADIDTEEYNVLFLGSSLVQNLLWSLDQIALIFFRDPCEIFRKVISG